MLAPSPCLLRVLTVLGGVEFEYDVGAGPVVFVHSVGLGLTEGVVSGTGLGDDLLLAMQIDIAGQDAALGGTVVSLDPVTWRVSIDVGAGNTLRVMGASASTTFDLHRFGYDQNVNTVAAQVTTAPEGPLGTWPSPVPLGGGYLRRRQAQAAQPIAVSGRVVTVRRGVHLSTNIDFTDVPEASVFHSGIPLAPAIHDADAFERFYEDITDGAAWQYCLNRTTRLEDRTWVYVSENDFAPDRRIDGWPYFSFGFSALEFIA